MSFKFKDSIKKVPMTVAEIGVVTGSIILTKKFADFNVLFKNQIAADPTYADKWYIKHQGAIKLVGGALAAAMIPNPWLKLVAIGIAIEGAITEIRVITTDDAGASFFDKIGSQYNSGSDNFDQEMIEAARRLSGLNDYSTQVSGNGKVINIDSWGGRGRGGTMVGRDIPMSGLNQYGTYVSGW